MYQANRRGRRVAGEALGMLLTLLRMSHLCLEWAILASHHGGLPDRSFKVHNLMQIFFFFFGLVIIGVGVMTSSLEGSSFQIGNDSSGDEGLPYRSVLPACTAFGNTKF